MSEDPFDFSNVKIPKKEMKEILGLLTKNKTKKSLELSIKLFDSIQTAGETIQAGAGGIIENIFDKIITSSGLMGPFNTLLSLIGAATAQASADAMISLYELVTSDATLSAIETATGAFGTMMDGLATGLDTASDFSVTVGGVSFSPFNVMLEGFAAFLGGGLFGAAAAFIGTLSDLIVQLGQPAPPGPPIPFTPPLGSVPPDPTTGIGPGFTPIIPDPNQIFIDPITGLPFDPSTIGPGAIGNPLNPGNTGVPTESSMVQTNALLSRLIDLQEHAWGG